MSKKEIFVSQHHNYVDISKNILYIELSREYEYDKYSDVQKLRI